MRSSGIRVGFGGVTALAEQYEWQGTILAVLHTSLLCCAHVYSLQKSSIQTNAEVIVATATKCRMCACMQPSGNRQPGATPDSYSPCCQGRKAAHDILQRAREQQCNDGGSADVIRASAGAIMVSAAGAASVQGLPDHCCKGMCLQGRCHAVRRSYCGTRHSTEHIWHYAFYLLQDLGGWDVLCCCSRLAQHSGPRLLLLGGVLRICGLLNTMQQFRPDARVVHSLFDMVVI